MATLNISITDSMREWIDAQVASGDYANASDYIRDLIRHGKDYNEYLREMIEEGEASGVSTRSISDIVDSYNN